MAFLAAHCQGEGGGSSITLVFFSTFTAYWFQPMKHRENT